ncbi:putative electron transport protein YccM [bioreactor metagenome]|uniref:Putative electron transport protein YccM n=1 Tax=bioreactor metagenome TaxID=1076179 RepID=A0A644TL86_9ZZZZ|nr:4Fe-4S binding protein [Acidaminococcaceae bacterium]
MEKFDYQKSQGNRKRQKNLQWIRVAMQLLFLVILVVGMYKTVKSAFVILLPLAFIAGNYFCGWICPFGTVQELFGKIGSIVCKKKFKMSLGLQKYLQYSRYVLAIIVASQLANTFLDLSKINAYKTFIRGMTGTFGQATAVFIMGGFLIAALFVERPFCNYCCTEGIKYGLASFTRFFTIRRNVATCVQCKRCDNICPMNINISTNKNVRNAQCINCFKCIEACPMADTLSYGMVNPLKKL